mgnify:CR=1 FL=1
MAKVIGGPAACSDLCNQKLITPKKIKKLKKTKQKKENWKKRPTIRGQIVVKLQEKYGKSFYTSERWIYLRYRVLDRSNGRCELCGRGKGEGAILHVDHIKPKSVFPELQYKIENLQVLCNFCNIGKADGEPTDWRKIPVDRTLPIANLT